VIGRNGDNIQITINQTEELRAFIMLNTQRKSLLGGLGLMAAAAFSLSVSPAAAATATGTMGVSATVLATCFFTTTPLSFGAYTGAQTDSTGTLLVTCSNTVPYNTGLDAGTAAGATVTTRKMTGPAGALMAYSLFQDSSRVTNWGNTVGTDTKAGTGNGAAQTLTVYGRLGAGQFVEDGGYADTITATVTY
jgi:spore coat protein U-like protein